MQEEKNILEKNQNEEAYSETNIIEGKKINQLEENLKNYYEESIYALIEYMKSNEKNPSENKWDKIAISEKYLSSKTIGYISGIGFNTLCRNLRKQINKNKRQIKE